MGFSDPRLLHCTCNPMDLVQIHFSPPARTGWWKWPKNGFRPHLGNGGKNGPKNGKNGQFRTISKLHLIRTLLRKRKRNLLGKQMQRMQAQHTYIYIYIDIDRCNEVTTLIMHVWWSNSSVIFNNERSIGVVPKWLHFRLGWLLGFS